MRLLICGDRNWDNYELIFLALRRIQENVHIECVIQGEARGADSLARLAAEQIGIPVKKYPADWDTYGKSAGPIRNQRMMTHGRPDAVMAFHNKLEDSKGTKHMVELATKAKLPVWVSQQGSVSLLKFISLIKERSWAKQS